MDASHPEITGLETEIVVPDTVDFQFLENPSAPKHIVTVVYDVIEANITSSGNTSLTNSSSQGYERDEDLARIEIAVLATIFALVR
ncbi:hypothetical protein ACOMHN_014776 [Nucella lapillus]